MEINKLIRSQSPDITQFGVKKPEIEHNGIANYQILNYFYAIVDHTINITLYLVYPIFLVISENKFGYEKILALLFK